MQTGTTVAGPARADETRRGVVAGAESTGVAGQVPRTTIMSANLQLRGGRREVCIPQETAVTEAVAGMQEAQEETILRGKYSP